MAAAAAAAAAATTGLGPRLTGAAGGVAFKSIGAAAAAETWSRHASTSRLGSTEEGKKGGRGLLACALGWQRKGKGERGWGDVTVQDVQHVENAAKAC